MEHLYVVCIEDLIDKIKTPFLVGVSYLIKVSGIFFPNHDRSEKNSRLAWII